MAAAAYSMTPPQTSYLANGNPLQRAAPIALKRAATNSRTSQIGFSRPASVLPDAGSSLASQADAELFSYSGRNYSLSTSGRKRSFASSPSTTGGFAAPSVPSQHVVMGFAPSAPSQLSAFEPASVATGFSFGATAARPLPTPKAQAAKGLLSKAFSTEPLQVRCFSPLNLQRSFCAQNTGTQLQVPATVANGPSPCS
jgi:hypothetical protein